MPVKQQLRTIIKNFLFLNIKSKFNASTFAYDKTTTKLC